ncbi:MAG TPA: response regulator [Allocoleopsis sp.]
MASIQKILIIDDNTAIRKIIRDMFPGDKVEILEAKNGKEALILIREQHPTLVILDFILPGTSGWDVFQAISNNPELGDISLVIMSGKKEEVLEKIPEPFEYFAFV